jgi:hypothetical protein
MSYSKERENSGGLGGERSETPAILLLGEVPNRCGPRSCSNPVFHAEHQNTNGDRIAELERRARLSCLSSSLLSIDFSPFFWEKQAGSVR